MTWFPSNRKIEETFLTPSPPVHHIYISPFPSFVIVSGCPNDWWGRYRIEFLEFNAFGRGYLSLSPFLPLDSSNDFLREDMKGEWTVETGWGRRRRNWKLERLESVARTLMRMEKKKKFWLIAGAQLFPWRHLEDTRISIFPSPSPPAILANPICPRRYSFILHLTSSSPPPLHVQGRLGMIETVDTINIDDATTSENKITRRVSLRLERYKSFRRKRISPRGSSRRLINSIAGHRTSRRF